MFPLDRNRNFHQNYDGIAFHFHETGHNIDFYKTEIIAEEKAYWKRLIIEGLEIKKEPTCRWGRRLTLFGTPSWKQ